MKFTKETLRRVIRTFLQAVIAYIAVNLVAVDFTSGKEVAKSALIGLCVSALSAGISAVMNLEKPQDDNEDISECGGSSTLDDFISKYKVGKSYAYNGTYKGECVSLVKCFIDEVLDKTPQAIGNAKDYWAKRNGAYLKGIFTPIANTPDFVPQRGDVFVRTSGVYGHIGIVLNATKDYFYTIEQNYNGCRVIKNIKHTDWRNINFLRPKNQSNIKSASSKFTIGKPCTLTTNVKIRTGAGTNCRQKKVSEINAAGQRRCTSQNRNDYAVLRKGIEIIPKQIKTVGNDIWVELINGWVCVYYNGNYYAK